MNIRTLDTEQQQRLAQIQAKLNELLREYQSYRISDKTYRARREPLDKEARQLTVRP
jgi:t-SNARE complex subunit (syntaxin)